MKIFFRILLFGLIGQLVIISFLTLFRFKMWRSFEQAEVIIGILGLVTTSLGAYLGAKIAGNESRKLFKQELKMNDLSKNMDVNLTVLENIEFVKRKLDNINYLNSNYFLEPDITKRVKDTAKEIKVKLTEIKKENLSSASVILYSDIQKFCEKYNYIYIKLDNIINIDDTRKLLKNINKAIDPNTLVNSWDKYSVFNQREIYISNSQNDDLETVSVDLIIEENKNFFEQKRSEVKKLIDDINAVFYNMEYKNRNDLIKEYTKLYKG
ncbi:hypothetical protein ACWEY2_08440 [Staphylococcus shinii]